MWRNLSVTGEQFWRLQRGTKLPIEGREEGIWDTVGLLYRFALYVGRSAAKLSFVPRLFRAAAIPARVGGAAHHFVIHVLRRSVSSLPGVQTVTSPSGE